MKRKLLSTASICFILAMVGILATLPGGTAQKVVGGTFRGYLTSEPSNLDPARGVDVNEGNVQAKIYDALVKYDEKMDLVGNLAESWNISDEGRTYTFKLRSGVKFHDGQPFTAKDVVFTLDRVLDPKVHSPRTWVLEKILGAKERAEGKSAIVTGIEVLDELTVKITLTESFAPFLSMLSMPACYILPSGSVKAITDKSFFDKPYGTGPFKLIGRERDSYIRLAANDDYYAGRPQVGLIELRIIPESLKAEMEFESGNLDILQLFPSNYDRFQAKSESAGKISDVAAMNVYYVGFNNQKHPFNDVKVRKALNYLINREVILKSVFKGRGSPAHGSIPPGILGYSEKLAGYEYSVKTGLDLLKQAGYGAHKPLKFDLFQKSSQAAFEITRLIQGELKKHGVIVTLRPMEWSALKDAIDKGEAPAFYLSWFGDYPDGENFLYPLFHSKNWGSGGNRARFKNEFIDQMISAAIKIQDPQKRGEAYDQINKLIVDEAPWLYLWHCNESYLTGPEVESMVFSPLFSSDKGLSMRMRQ